MNTNGLGLFAILALTINMAMASGEVVQEARMQQMVSPTYPRIEQRLSHEGRVVVLAAVDSDGTVVATKLGKSSGWWGLDEAALSSVYDWKFIPARDAAGAAIASIKPLSVNFKIKQPAHMPPADIWTMVAWAVNSYHVYEHSSLHVLQACADIGLATDKAAAKLNDDAQELSARAQRLDDMLATMKPGMEREALMMELAYENNLGLAILRDASEQDKMPRCKRFVDDVLEGRFTYEHFDRRGHEVLSGLKLNELEKQLPKAASESI